MADLLTQLQDAFDQMATQFYSVIRYLSNHHDAVPLNGESKVKDESVQIDTPSVFRAAQTELARDLVFKATQIDLLIASLPGIGVSEEYQRQRLRILELNLQRAEAERDTAVAERDEARKRLDATYGREQAKRTRDDP